MSEKTTTYLNATNNLLKDGIDDSTVVTYTQLLEDTAHKYEEMLGSDMWTPKVPSKKQQDEPDLSAAGLQAVVDKAVHTSLQKIGAKSKKNRGQKSGKPLFSKKVCFHHCDETGHRKEHCSHKD